LLDHLPKSIIVKTGIPARYIAIAAPLQAECNPICLAKNPSLSSLMDDAAIFGLCRSSFPVNKCSLLLLSMNVLTVLSLVVEALTGQMMASPERC